MWYHFDISGFIPSAIRLFSYWCVVMGIGCGVVARCTCPITSTPLRVPYRDMSNFSLLLYVWQLMWVYIYHHIFSLCILVPLIGGGLRCVLFWIFYIKRGLCLVLPYGFPVCGFCLGGLIAVLVLS